MRRLLVVGSVLAVAVVALSSCAACRPVVRDVVHSAPDGVPRGELADVPPGGGLPDRPPGEGLPDVPPSAGLPDEPTATEDALRAERLDDELLETAHAWGRSACDVAEYIESLQDPPTLEGMLAEYSPGAWKAVAAAQELYKATLALADDGATLAELGDAYCAAS